MGAVRVLAEAEATRLIPLVRGLPAGEFSELFRNGLSPHQLARVIAALPVQRLGQLIERARRPAEPGRPRPADQRLVDQFSQHDLAAAIRTARTRAGLTQPELGRRLGVQQPSVSQWEFGLTRPSGRHLVCLILELPELLDLLNGGGALAPRPIPAPLSPR